MKFLRAYATVLLASAVLICSNPTVAFAGTEEMLYSSSKTHYTTDDNSTSICLEVNVNGNASHNESFLHSVYSVSGSVSTIEVSWGKNANQYCWGELSGDITLSSFGVFGADVAVTTEGKTPGGGASASVQAEDDTASISCDMNSQASFSASVSSVGFISCNLDVSYYVPCYSDTGRLMDTHSDSASWDLYDMLNY